MRKKIDAKKSVKIFYYILPVLCLIPLLYISRYARPIVDDFDYGILTHEAVLQGRGFFGVLQEAFHTTENCYRNFQGTYASCFLMSLQPGIFGEQYYGITTFLMIGIIFLGFGCFFRTMKKHFLKDQPGSLFWTLLCAAIVIQGMPSPAEGIYWYVGAVHYIPWMMLLLCNMAAVLEIYFAGSRAKMVWMTILSCILSFLISGGNQLTSFANILLLLIALIYMICRKRNYSLFFSLFVAAAGFVMMLVAPGNAVRQSFFEQPGVIKTMVMSLLYAVKWSMEWINGVSITAMLLLLPLIVFLGKRIRNSFFCRYPLITFLLSAMVFCGMACVPFYAMGGFGDGRTINVLWIYWMGALAWNLTCLSGWLYQKSRVVAEIVNVRKWNVSFVCFLVGIVIITMFSSGANGEYASTMKAVRELRNHEAQIYAEESDERFVLYHDESLKSVEVEPLSVKPSLLYLHELNEDSKEWPNTAIADYYHKERVILKSVEKE